MNTLNLIDLYKTLKQPVLGRDKNQLRFSASQIPGFENHRLAKDSFNNPSILLSTFGKSKTHPAPIKLEHLRVLYNVDCKITQENKSEENRFTVITCTENDPLMQEYFLRTSSAIINAIGNTPTQAQITKAVDNLVELFRVINESPRKSVQGLWAELFVIAFANSSIDALQAWHRSPIDKYDFISDKQRLEVKSSTSNIRQHHFSLDQLKPSTDLEILVASVFIERIGNGISIAELADIIRSKVAKYPELLVLLDQIIGKTLGNKWRSFIDDRFDLQLAKNSLKFFSSEKIPCISQKLPKEISEVHFKIDLTELKGMDIKKIKKMGGLFEAIAHK